MDILNISRLPIPAFHKGTSTIISQSLILPINEDIVKQWCTIMAIVFKCVCLYVRVCTSVCMTEFVSVCMRECVVECAFECTCSTFLKNIKSKR